MRIFPLGDIVKRKSGHYHHTAQQAAGNLISRRSALGYHKYDKKQQKYSHGSHIMEYVIDVFKY